MRLDDPQVRQRVFYPRRGGKPPTRVVDVGEARLGCFLSRRDPEAGLLLHFHGNGELAAEYATEYGSWFEELGVNVCFAEYRGYGASTGEPDLVGMLGDGERIVSDLGIPPERIVVFGRSLGSLYAIELARRLPTLAGLILESGIADTVDLLRLFFPGLREPQLEAEAAVRFPLEAALRAYSGPVLVLHAVKDDLIEPSHGQRLHAWAGGTDKQLVLFDRGDHNSIYFANARRYEHEVRAFLRRAGIARETP
jgi:hypothetical protein